RDQDDPAAMARRSKNQNKTKPAFSATTMSDPIQYPEICDRRASQIDAAVRPAVGGRLTTRKKSNRTSASENNMTYTVRPSPKPAPAASMTDSSPNTGLIILDKLCVSMAIWCDIADPFLGRLPVAAGRSTDRYLPALALDRALFG